MPAKKIIEILSQIQSTLKAPKNQYNNFGKYKYRNCEDILEALKPLLKEHGCALSICDCPIVVGERVYIQAIATLHYEDETIQAQAYAREAETKKGMDEAQLTGATSSYARKYALNGLFAIDDTKDADATNDHGQSNKPAPLTDNTPVSINDNQAADLIALCDEVGIDRQEFLGVCKKAAGRNLGSIADLPADKLQGAIKWLDENR